MKLSHPYFSALDNVVSIALLCAAMSGVALHAFGLAESAAFEMCSLIILTSICFLSGRMSKHEEHLQSRRD